MPKNHPSYLSITRDCSLELSSFIRQLNPDKTGLLVDENTRKFCLPLINFSFDLIIEIKSGEQHKTLPTCEYIWQQLTTAGFSRKSLLVNLGGGVIGDMGGFAAATYKRGVPFVNIPTTLLAQVDASIGGKLGVDFQGLKNHIGVFKVPDKVIIDTRLLETVPHRELVSGYAEVVKHSLIRDKAQWEKLQSTSFSELDWEEIIPHSIGIKNKVVEADPYEKGLRKILNFGHTLGHAIETYLLDDSHPLLHGEAVAIGMILESHLSLQQRHIDDVAFQEIASHLMNRFEINRALPDYEKLKPLLQQDKKNKNAHVSFSLLRKIGECTYDCFVTEEMIIESLEAFAQMKRSSSLP